jgi:soluble lytic murein transglycosylase-like protein/LysM repeat protein
MGARAGLVIIGLALGMGGCGPVAQIFSDQPQLGRQVFLTPQPLIPAPQMAENLEIGSRSSLVAQQPDVQTERRPAPVLSYQNEQARLEPPQAIPEASVIPRKPEAREPRGRPREEARKPVAPVYWPRADDRLMALVQKDLDKAIEQPKERRRLQFSKAVIENPRVRYYINQYTKKQKEEFAKTLARSGRYFQMIADTLQEEGLPEELAFLALIESNFSPHATSSSGAVGLWQFVPSTARHYGLKIDGWLDERRDPVKSTRAAAAYLKALHDYYGKWYLATAAYNAGQGTIDRAMQKSGSTDYWSIAEKNHLSEETRNFVPKFVAVTLIASNPKKYGFSTLTYEEPLEYEEVEIYRSLSLESLADLADTDVGTIQELNPALLRNSTPPDEITFRLKLPAGKSLIFAKSYQQLKEKETESTEIVTHEVKRGETLFSIARRYGQEVRALMQLNGLSSPRLRIGQQLKVIVDRLRGGLR